MVENIVNHVTYNPPRPKITNDIKFRIALEIAEKYPELNNELSKNDIATAIVKVIDNKIKFDGYEIARKLDSFENWAISTETVNILEQFSNQLQDEQIRLQAEWAQTNNILPPFPVGTKVKFSFLFIYPPMEGTIIQISDEYPACYKVNFRSEYLSNGEYVNVTVFYEDCWLSNQESQ